MSLKTTGIQSNQIGDFCSITHENIYHKPDHIAWAV